MENELIDMDNDAISLMMKDDKAEDSAEEEEHTLSVTNDKGTMEKENVEEDKVVEDQLDWMEKQYNTDNRRKKQNKEKRINICTRNCIATVHFLDLRASLEDPDDHKEKPLTCDMEPDIYCAQQWKLVYNRWKIKKKPPNKRSPDDQIMHKPIPLSCDLEPDIAVMQREMISRMKLIIRDTRQLVDLKMHSMEPLSCDLEPDIMITYTKMTKQQKRK